MKVSIDQTKCVICHTCIALCPEVFEAREDGMVAVKPEYQGVEITDEELQKKVREAADACAASAIIVEE